MLSPRAPGADHTVGAHPLFPGEAAGSIFLSFCSPMMRRQRKEPSAWVDTLKGCALWIHEVGAGLTEVCPTGESSEISFRVHHLSSLGFGRLRFCLVPISGCGSCFRPGLLHEGSRQLFFGFGRPREPSRSQLPSAKGACLQNALGKDGLCNGPTPLFGSVTKCHGEKALQTFHFVIDLLHPFGKVIL